MSIPDIFRALRHLSILLCLALGAGAYAADPIAQEKAFAMSVRAIDPSTVEVVFDIAPGYYLYGERFQFEVKTPGVVLGKVDRPPGERKHDLAFGEVEAHRGRLRMSLPVEETPPGLDHFTLSVTSQGCWDGGVCYPPMTQAVDISLAASSSVAGSSFIDRVLAPPVTSAVPPDRAPGPDTGDESGRISDLLRDAGAPLVLASFFGLGLLLAFTPCTFPMIPILSGIIVGAGPGVSRGRALALALAYVFGMAFTYAVAGVIAGLTGTLLAAMLQNAWILLVFALVFVVLALSMFGFFELQLPATLQSRLANTANRGKGG